MKRMVLRASALLAAACLSFALSPAVATAGNPCATNGTLESGEGCDDNNTEGGDGCFSCQIENGYPCNSNPAGAVGDASCASGVCDDTETTPTCEQEQTCGNSLCEFGAGETCATCEEDCGTCPIDTTTSTTSTTSTTTSTTESTTTTVPETTTSTIDTTTTTQFSSTSTTLAETGACCAGSGCLNITQALCQGEFFGMWQGEGTSCTEPGICVNCGNGCIEFGEECDDGDTLTPDDGCDATCKEEQCWNCGLPQGDPRIPIGGCVGPSTCIPDVECSECGNGEVELGEDCDDGGTASGDCCDSDCQFELSGSSCSDDYFCNGDEVCDGAGVCTSGQQPSCARLDTECSIGICDPKLDECVASALQDGAPCEGGGECVTSEGGTCQDGVCVGTATTLSPTCRWIVLGASADSEVRVRTGAGSTVDADICGDTAKIGGITPDDIVAVSTTGEGVRFYGPPEVGGDIVTGGSTVRANLYLDIPGTVLKLVDTGLSVPKDPAPSVVDTTGLHALVDTCNDDQTLLANAIPVLDAMGDAIVEEGTGNGLKVGIGSGYTIDVTGDGVAVVDMNGLKVGHGATLTLKGSASDVVILRINGGRLKIGYGAQVMLDGLVPQNVLIYADGPRCRLSPGVTGAGTVFCPESGRFIIGAGVEWSGTFLGASREVRVRSNADLTHVPFTGF